MTLTLLLLVVIIGLSLLVLFRSQESRLPQFLAVAEVALGAFTLFLDRVQGFSWPWSRNDSRILLAGAMAVLSLIIFITLKDRVWSAVLVFATILLVLVRIEVVTGL
jgi:hypothetical protein